MAPKTNKILFTAVLLCSVCGHAARAAEIETNTARMQAMDKITGKVSEIDVPVNVPVKFGSFSVLVRKCVTRTPEETPENTAFVDVVDDYNSQEPVNIFKGWMLSSSPALNAVEHPIYDVWLLNCYDKDNKDVKKLSEEELRARDEIKMARADEPKEEAAKAETETSRQPSELDAMVKKTIAGGIASETAAEDEKETKDEVKAEVVEVVVSAPETEAGTDGDAPQALFRIQTEETETVDVAPAPAAADAESETTPEPEAVPAEVPVFEFEDENGYTEEDEIFEE